jgi:hypothetical protein
MIAESSAQFDVTANGRQMTPATVEVIRWSVGALLGLLFTAAAVVVWRRMVGALTSPLDPSALLTVGLMLVAVAAGTRLLWRRFFATVHLSLGAMAGVRETAPETTLAVPRPPHYFPSMAAEERFRPTYRRGDRQLGWTVAVLPSASVLAMGITLSLPGTVAGALWLFWALLAAEEAWAWQPTVGRAIQRQRHSRGQLTGDQRQTAGVRRQVAVADRQSAVDSCAESAVASSVLPQPASSPFPLAPQRHTEQGTLLQQLTRRQTADGSEELSGCVRVPFAAGQRTGNAHLAFCPPFAKAPELAVEQIDGPSCRIKTVQLLPYGARLELKLTAAADAPTNVLLQFSAHSTARD